MSGIQMKYKQLKKEPFEKIENGIYILEVEDIIEDTTQNDSTKIVMSHVIINTGKKINYDNYVLFDKKGNVVAFGSAKLRTLIDAMGLEIEEITIPILKALMIGRRFKANVISNDKGYPNINYADIYALNDPDHVALNADKDENSSNITEEENSPEDVEVNQEVIDTQDI